jgi:hypothetical protein
LPSANDRTGIFDALSKTQRKQHAYAVGVNQESGSQSMPSLLALDELGPKAMPMKRRGRGETSYASADDQDRFDLCHMPSHRIALDRHCAVRKRLAGSATADLGLGGTMTWTGANSCSNVHEGDHPDASDARGDSRARRFSTAGLPEPARAQAVRYLHQRERTMLPAGLEPIVARRIYSISGDLIFPHGFQAVGVTGQGTLQHFHAGRTAQKVGLISERVLGLSCLRCHSAR